jgi:hypothetical protein
LGFAIRAFVLLTQAAVKALLRARRSWHCCTHALAWHFLSHAVRPCKALHGGLSRRYPTEPKVDSVFKWDVEVIKSDVEVFKSDVEVFKSDVGVFKSDVEVFKSDVEVV